MPGWGAAGQPNSASQAGPVSALTGTPGSASNNRQPPSDQVPIAYSQTGPDNTTDGRATSTNRALPAGRFRLRPSTSAMSTRPANPAGRRTGAPAAATAKASPAAAAAAVDGARDIREITVARSLGSVCTSGPSAVFDRIGSRWAKTSSAAGSSGPVPSRSSSPSLFSPSLPAAGSVPVFAS